jgi:hypothetical protein
LNDITIRYVALEEQGYSLDSIGGNNAPRALPVDEQNDDDDGEQADPDLALPPRIRPPEPEAVLRAAIHAFSLVGDSVALDDCFRLIGERLAPCRAVLYILTLVCMNRNVDDVVERKRKICKFIVCRCSTTLCCSR